MSSGLARKYIVSAPQDYEQVGEDDQRLAKHSINDIKDLNRLPAS